MRKLPPIIDGQRNVISGFYQDHHSKAWYIEAQQYLKERRAFVQERFVDCMRYLETLFAKPSTDDIWTNIGLQYEEDSFDMNAMQRLFPDSE